MTLVELLVVAVLLAVLSGLLYGTLSGIIRARENLLIKRQAYRSAANFFTRIRSEFGSALAEPLFQGGGQSSAPGSGLGASGAAGVGPVTYLVGTNGKGGENSSDMIHFSTSSGAQELYDAESNRGLIEITYRVELSATPGLTGDSFGVLMRDEIPAGVKNEATVLRRRRTFPVCDRVISFNLLYYRDKKWQSEWKDSSSRLPKAIDIELILADDKGDPVYTRTALPFGPPKLETAPSSIKIAGSDLASGGSPSPAPSPSQ